MSTGLPPGHEPPAGVFDAWREVGAGVLVRRHRVLDLNVTLVLGDERALVVDTHGHDRWARDLVAHVRGVTALPWVVVTSHAHFDHAFGNAVLAAEQPGLEIWGHDGCRRVLEEDGDLVREQSARWLREAGREQDAAEVERVRVVPPTRTFTEAAVVDLGGREVTLRHPGRGHTDHDVVVDVPDADLSVVADLVEQGAPPSFGDAHPLDWPVTLDRLLPTLGSVVVPGHGDVVDPAFVAAQRDDLAQVAEVARALPDPVDELALLRAAARLRVGRRAGLDALRRHLALR